jgi:replication factor A1
MNSDEIVEQILKKTSFSRDEIMQKIEKKQKELGGFVSEEGAAHLVAKEYGLDFLNNTKRKLQIRNIISGMKNVTFAGRIFRISNIIEFKRADGSSGSVVNLYLGDSSGFCKVALWNDQVKLVDEETVKIGDAIQIISGFAKENIYGDMEVSLGKFGKIAIAADADLPSAEELTRKFGAFQPQRTYIANIVPGNFEVKATVVDVFKGNFIFSVCPMCAGKVSIDASDGNGKAKCAEHGEVEASNALVINTVVDDGTESLRAIFFRDKAEKLIDMIADEIAVLTLEKRYEWVRERSLGKELLLVGKVKKNKVFNRLEMLVDEIKEINPLEESKRIAEEIELKLGV